jgi:guanylate kinase
MRLVIPVYIPELHNSNIRNCVSISIQYVEIDQFEELLNVVKDSKVEYVKIKRYSTYFDDIDFYNDYGYWPVNEAVEDFKVKLKRIIRENRRKNAAERERLRRKNMICLWRIPARKEFLGN